MRLTNALRNIMADNAVKRLNLKDKVLNLMDRYKAFVDSCRHEINGVYDHEIDSALGNLKEDIGKWMVHYPVYKGTSFYVFLQNGSKLKLDVNGYLSQFGELFDLMNLSTDAEFPKRFGGLNTDKYIRESHRFSGVDEGAQFIGNEFLTKYEQLIEEVDLYFNKIHETRSAVLTATGNIKTVKKLLELWPEAKLLLPTEQEGAEKVNFPAVPVKMINELLNLNLGAENG